MKMEKENDKQVKDIMSSEVIKCSLGKEKLMKILIRLSIFTSFISPCSIIASDINGNKNIERVKNIHPWGIMNLNDSPSIR